MSHLLGQRVPYRSVDVQLANSWHARSAREIQADHSVRTRRFELFSPFSLPALQICRSYSFGRLSGLMVPLADEFIRIAAELVDSPTSLVVIHGPWSRSERGKARRVFRCRRVTVGDELGLKIVSVSKQLLPKGDYHESEPAVITEGTSDARRREHNRRRTLSKGRYAGVKGTSP